MHVKRPLVITREGGWNKESKPKFKEQFEERYGRGNETTDGPIIKDPKTTIDTLDLSPADAQLLESREYQVTDIARSSELPATSSIRKPRTHPKAVRQFTRRRGAGKLKVR